MNRRKILEVVLTIAVLGAVGAWSYTSGSSGTTSAASFPTSSNPHSGSSLPSSKPGGGGAATTAATTTVPAPTTTVAANPQAYADALFRYWTSRDRAHAVKVASAAAVRRLFLARPWLQSDGWTSQGCQTTAGSLYCTWVSPARKFVFQVQSASPGVPLQVVSLAGSATKGPSG
jgi:hypothetical protein